MVIIKIICLFALALIPLFQLVSPPNQLQYFFLLSIIYVLLFIQIIKKNQTAIFWMHCKEVLITTSFLCLFFTAPLIFALLFHFISFKINYLIALEINIILALSIVSFYYLCKNWSLLIAKAFLFINIFSLFLINSVFVSLLYTTGYEFTPTVFLHIDKTSILVALQQNGLSLLGIVAISVPVLFKINYWLNRQKNKHNLSSGFVALNILAVSLNVAQLNVKNYDISSAIPAYELFYNLLQYQNTDFSQQRKIQTSIKFSDAEKEALKQLGINLIHEKKPYSLTQNQTTTNLIIIYLESIQSNFTKRGGWPDRPLMPTLDSLPSSFTVFDNMYNSVTPTINAIVSSQCGINLEIEEGGKTQFNLNPIKDKNLKAIYETRLVCLSDYLHTKNYQQAFIKGAPMKFSGKREFLEAHNYDYALGLHEINAKNQYKHILNSWGVPDSGLFEESKKQLELLRKSGKPFSLNILTINSHYPGFSEQQCPVYEKGNTLLNGIHCSDFKLKSFLDYLKNKQYYKDTLIVLIGDHVMFPSGGNTQKLKQLPQLSWYGKTFFAIHDPLNRLEPYISTASYTPDLAPTILDLLGFGEIPFPDGKSIIQTRKNYQRLIAKNFEIHNLKQNPESIKVLKPACSLADLNKTTINLDSFPLSPCQREKIHYAKHLYLYQ